MLLEEQYNIGPKLGEGTFGVVHLIIEKSTGKKFAMKQLIGDFSTWGDFNSFRELQVLMDLSRHPNIVEIHEVHLTSTCYLFFVFEYMNGGSLYDLIMTRFHHQQQQLLLQQQHHPTTTNHNMLLLHEDEIRSILQQTLQGLSHMHKEGYMHRDMKPENILVHTGGVYKVADFSLARKYHSHHHGSCTTATTTTVAAAWWHDRDPLTAYVSTRWYRAPEILLGMQDYGPAVDAYAMACIAAECFKGVPLFPGKTEIDQLHRIFQLLGEPTRQSLKQGWEHVQASPFSVSSFPSPSPQTTPPPPSNVITLSSWTPDSNVSTSSAEYHKNTSHLLHQAVPMASPQAIDFIVRLLRLDPNKRLTCDQALLHGFLRQSPSSSFLSPPTQQRRHSSLATVREETSRVGEASAVGEPAQHVSPTSETPPAQSVAAPPSTTLLSPSKVATAGAASTVAATVSTHDRTLDIPMLNTPANAAITQDDAMKSSLSFSSSSGSCTMSTSSSSSSSSSSSMSSDSSDDDDSRNDESVMSTQKT